MTDETRRRAGNLIRIGISAGLLMWLLCRFDLGGIWGYFKDLTLSVWTTAFLMLMLAQVLSSIRWWTLARTFSFPGRWPTYLGFYYVGMFFNLFLPTGINIHLPLAFYFVSLPLVGIITLIPVSFNGIGVREGAFVYFFGLKGIPAESAFGLGLLFFQFR